MFRKCTSLVGSLLGVSLVLSAAAPAEAGGRCHDRAGADIEVLKAELRHDRGAWRLSVRYAVEIEDARPSERFELVISLTEGRCPVRDPSGRPVRFVVPLGRPARGCGDAWNFRDQIVTRLPSGAISDPRRLRVQAVIVRCQGGPALDRAESCVAFRACGSGCGVCNVSATCSANPRPRVAERWEQHRQVVIRGR